MNNSNISNYLYLSKKFEQVHNIKNILNIVEWDYSTFMPSLSATNRQDDIATLSSIAHEIITSSEVQELIIKAETETSSLDHWQLANLREMKRHVTHAISISTELQKDFIKASGECEFIWREARKNNDFNQLKPYLERVVHLVKEISQAKAQCFSSSKYDALIDQYDPDSNSNNIKKIYAILKKELPNLLNQIMEKQSIEELLPITETIDANTQKAIGIKIMEKMGFNFKAGRLDESAHPFCGGTSTDVRITTRYNVNNFVNGIMGIIHETGHALYEMNLPNDYTNQYVGKARGMAFHESQSLIMEMQACRSREFIEFLAKLLRDDFGFRGKEYSSDNLFKMITRVTPSFIRVDADEVTYPLHVILRFEIEEAIFEGNLTVNEIPQLWNEKMQKYLGIIPDSFALGCLQDIHWPSGSFGYFPSYTNGAIIASMLMNSAKAQFPNINSNLVQGDFNELNLYLNQNLRNFGCLYKSGELLEKATGYEEIQSNIFINYLTEKYLK